MIDGSLYAVFIGVALLVICTPGQDTALTIRNTLLGRRRAGIATAAGVASGQAVWTAATTAGLAALLAASAPLFLAIRLAGAAYLIYLGARSLSSAVRRRRADERIASPATPGLSASSAFVQGFLSNLSNAKMVAFFISVLPQFAGAHPSFGLLLALGLNFCVITLIWLCAYAFAVERASLWLRRGAVRRAIDGLLGVVLIGLGLRVSAQALAR